MEIGSKGLAEVNLVIPQGTSLMFDIAHKTEDGEVIDHSQSTAHMAFQSTDKKTNYDMSSCCTCTSERIRVAIPASMTEPLPLGKLLWDMIVTTELGEQVRMCYGKVSIVDTYSLDEV